MMSAPYPLDSADDWAGEHHDLLSALFDQFSLQRVVRLMQPQGRRMLEVGAGGGGFAHRLADLVGEGGYVLAVDKDPRHIRAHRQLSAMSYDLTGPVWHLGLEWDLIHARLTLAHLPERRKILHQMVRALAPGGVLLIEDWYAADIQMVLATPDEESAALYDRFQEVLGSEVFAAAGTDRTWARQIHAAMISEGLTRVDTEVCARSWTGGGLGCRLIAGTLEQVRPRLVAKGLSADELTRVRELLADSRFVLVGHPLYSTGGYTLGGDER